MKQDLTNLPKSLLRKRNQMVSESPDSKTQEAAHDGFMYAVELLWPCVEACEFYGDTDNWDINDLGLSFDGDDDPAGSRAREALKEAGLK